MKKCGDTRKIKIFQKKRNTGNGEKSLYTHTYILSAKLLQEYKVSCNASTCFIMQICMSNILVF